MGCVQAKGGTYTPPRGGGLDKLKLDNGYVKGGSNGRPITQKPPLKGSGGGDGVNGSGERKISKEGEINGVGNVSQRISIKKIGADELVDGWPKWLVENISSDVLAGLVPKSADSYDKLAKVGQGTYSNVYKARDRDTGKIVALKKVRFDTSEPKSVKFMAREIIILQRLDHPNIIKLEGLATSRMQYSLYLVFDFMQTDLTRVISCSEGRLTEPQVKCYMQQLLSGLEHCHERGILHRDIKGSNLLIDKDGMLKIADFGLANFYEPKQKRPLTSRVVTLWYRAPELLLGSSDYGVGIDLWSAGCLLAEMFIGRPIMPGRTEVEQLHRIFKLCGSPPEDYWKKIKPPTTFRPPQNYQPSFQEAFTNFPPSSFGLLTTLLALNGSFRGTATSALQAEFFTSSPLACDLSGLPAMNKEVDLPSQYNDWKKKTNQRSLKNREGLGSLISGIERGKENLRSPKGVCSKCAILVKHAGVNVLTIVGKDSTAHFKSTYDSALQVRENNVEPYSQEMANSASSSSLSKTTSRNQEESPPRTPSPSFHLNRNRSARTEAHPNALKNIKNFPLLLASITETVNHFEDNRLRMMPLRSRSTVDFRRLDMEKMSKLFGNMEEDH